MKQCKNKKLKRLWVLYGTFFTIVVITLGLFLSDILITNDHDDLIKFKEQQKSLNFTTIRSTDLKSSASEYIFDIPIENPSDSAIHLSARVNGYDIVISTEDVQKLGSPYQTLTYVFQCIWLLCLVLVFVFVFVILYSFYKSIKQGTVFQKRDIRWLTLIGVLFLVMTLSFDVARYFEHQYVLQFLQGTSVEVDGSLYINFVRILSGLLILFVAELFKIGSDIQEEQDLTI